MQGSEATTTVERFVSVTPGEFENEIERLWEATSQIKDVVVGRVKDGDLPPMTGLGIISCITGQVFGYGYAHGQPSVAELTSLSNSERTLQAAGSRS